MSEVIFHDEFGKPISTDWSFEGSDIIDVVDNEDNTPHFNLEELCRMDLKRVKPAQTDSTCAKTQE